MADDVTLSASTGGGAVIATDEDTSTGGSVHYQYVKVVYGPDGTFSHVQSTGGLPIKSDGTNLTFTSTGVVITSGSVTSTGVVISSAPAAGSTSDAIAASLSMDEVMQGLVPRTPVHVSVEANSSGNNTLVAAPTTANEKIRILAMALFSDSTAAAGSTSGNMYIQDGSTAAMIGGSTVPIDMSNGAAFVLPFSPVGWGETGSTVALNLFKSTDSFGIGGTLVYAITT